ncbi:hypothetical protein [Deinococcus taeanensis]
MTHTDRLERLFGIVTLAWVWCLCVGVNGALSAPSRSKPMAAKP